jgi:hypothetical protein
MTMMNHNVIFGRPRHHYKPYDDFFAVANMSGYPIRYIDDIDWRTTNRTVIAPIKSPEWECIPGNKKARLIWWNLERGIDDAPFMDMANPMAPACVDEVWASDRAYARKIGAKYVFLGGNRAFGAVSVTDKQFDVVTLMYWSGRRQVIRGALSTLTSADKEGGLWGEERHKRLMQSRLMVTAHQDDQPWSEPIRWMLAGCYALPILSEACLDSGYWEPQSHYHVAPISELGIMARLLLQKQNGPALARVGASAWRLVCIERPFRQEVEAAL